MHKFIVFAALALLLGGCAGNYQHYAASEPLHFQHEANRITNQTNGIVSALMLYTPKTDGEALLMAILGADRIAQLKPRPYTLTRPTQWEDVLMRHTGTLVGGLVTLGTSYFSNDMFKEFASGWGLSTVSSEGGPISFEGSFNRSEQHFTSSDGNTGSLSPYIARPEVVQPEIVFTEGGE